MSLTTTTPPGTLRVIRQWQSEVDAIVHAPEPRGAQSAVWLLALMLTTMIGITPFVHVDRVVSSSSGQVVSRDSLVTVQPLDPSIIKSVDVREGQRVEAGQVLATLDPTLSQADVGQLRQQVESLDAQIARDTAELTGKPLEFPPSASGGVASYQSLQLQLHKQRQAEYASNIQSFDGKIDTIQATIAKLKNDESRYAQRQEVSQQIETMRDTLFKSGSASRLSLLQANDARLDLERQREFDHNSLVESQHQLVSLQADRDTYIQHWMSDANQDRLTARNTRDQAVASLLKASKHNDLVQITAPEPSMVLWRSTLSVGSVLNPADKLMTLMPLRSPVEAEVDIPSNEIGFVREGDPVSLKVDAFNYYEHGWADGKVAWISENSFTQDQNQQPVAPYYKAHVTIDELHFTGVPQGFRLIPGMTLRDDINIGKRSLFAYIMGGFVRGAGEAMREP